MRSGKHRDEALIVKRPASHRSLAVRLMEPRRIIGMTATPITNRTSELGGLLKLWWLFVAKRLPARDPYKADDEEPDLETDAANGDDDDYMADAEMTL